MNDRNEIPTPEISGKGTEEDRQALLAVMQQKKKFSGLLGIAKKAGKVVAGTNLVTDAIRSASPSKYPWAVFVAEDASENTKKRVINCCTYYEVPYYLTALDSSVMGDAIGKSGSISAVGITDKGIADALAKLLHV